MTIFRYKKNGLLYTITHHKVGLGWVYKVHPYNHKTEIGIIQKKRFREFRVDMELEDFERVAER
jgi:hypothetical protein